MGDYMFLLFQRGDNKTLANEAFYLGKEHSNGFFSYYEFENKCLLVSSVKELQYEDAEKIYYVLNENSEEPIGDVIEFVLSEKEVQNVRMGKPIEFHDKDKEL